MVIPAHRQLSHQPELASLSRRLTANFIDLLFLIPVMILLSATLRVGAAQSIIFTTLVYYPGSWLVFSATPGMLLLDCQVLDARTGGSLRKEQAFLRYICCVISMAPLGLGWVPVLWDKQRRALHDMMATTLVVETESEYDERDDESCKSLEQLLDESFPKSNP